MLHLQKENYVQKIVLILSRFFLQQTLDESVYIALIHGLLIFITYSYIGTKSLYDQYKLQDQ